MSVGLVYLPRMCVCVCVRTCRCVHVWVCGCACVCVWGVCVCVCVFVFGMFVYVPVCLICLSACVYRKQTVSTAVRDLGVWVGVHMCVRTCGCMCMLLCSAL